MTQKTQDLNLTWIQRTGYGYYQDRRIGQGFGGIIYQGFDRRNCSSIAVKILKDGSGLQNQISFTQMVKITSQNYPGEQQLSFTNNRLITIFDVIQLDKTYVIMQLCQSNLKQYLNKLKDKIQEGQLLRMIKNITQALLTVTKAGYHYSDLKPQNILITKQGQAKLGDIQSLIGLGKQNQRCKSYFHGSLFGTLQYMPPELIELGQYGPKNYIWSLGVMLHQIIYGEAPFHANETTCPGGGTRQQNHIHRFYKNLFNLKIKNHLSKRYPRCHNLLSQLLHLNLKRRISLQKLYELLLDQESPSRYYEPTVERHSNLGKSIRSSSQHTNDSMEGSLPSKGHRPLIIHSIDGKDCPQDALLSDYNQKQNQPQKECKPQDATEIAKGHRDSQLQHLEMQLKTKITQQTIPLILAIRNPQIFVRKLQGLVSILEQFIGHLNALVEKGNFELFWVHFQNLVTAIKSSKAVSHLEKTVKFAHSQSQRQLNRKQLDLCENIQSLYEFMAQKQVQKLIKNIQQNSFPNSAKR